MNILSVSFRIFVKFAFRSVSFIKKSRICMPSLLTNAGFSAVLEPAGVTSNVYYMSVVQQPVEKGKALHFTQAPALEAGNAAGVHRKGSF